LAIGRAPQLQENFFEKGNGRAEHQRHASFASIGDYKGRNCWSTRVPPRHVSLLLGARRLASTRGKAMGASPEVQQKSNVVKREQNSRSKKMQDCEAQQPLQPLFACVCCFWNDA
jgi:hypothetical protein